MGKQAGGRDDDNDGTSDLQPPPAARRADRRLAEHLPRIAGMGFDRVYVNAFWTPGASGSIYAIADPYELHPLVRGAESALPADRLFARFADAAREHGLEVMVDLVVPHAAKDSKLALEHPDWFRRHGNEPVSPVLANPSDPRRPRVMGDLAELEFSNPALWPAQVDYFARLAGHYLDLGASASVAARPTRCPPDFWRALIGQRARGATPRPCSWRQALGCPFDQVRPLKGCGFDLIFDSSRWWDFHAPWFLEQHDELRRIAAPVAFPEDHNTPRLAEAFDVEEPDDVDRLYRARYLYAAAVSCGVLMPMGFEYGARRPPRPGPHPARGLAGRDRPAGDRPHRLHHRGERVQGGDRRLERARPVAPGDVAQRPRRGPAAARRRDAARRRGRGHNARQP
jgi:starch synthase (maltosyl-transferring)